MTNALSLQAAESQQSFGLDILHVSDSHFRAKGSSADDAWERFLEDVRTRIASKEFRPQLIAFTGDLIETPGPWLGWRSATRGVHHLLELCAVCGFIQENDVRDGFEIWDELPDCWWAVVNKKLFLVPGITTFISKVFAVSETGALRRGNGSR